MKPLLLNSRITYLIGFNGKILCILISLAALHIKIYLISSAQKMSSRSSAHSATTSTASTASQDSQVPNVDPGLSAGSPEPECSCRHSGSVSASSATGSHVEPTPSPISEPSALKSSPLSRIDKKLSNATSGAPATGQKKKSKSNQGCICGISFDFHYRNLLTSSGAEKSTLGTGGGAPTGCDLM